MKSDRLIEVLTWTARVGAVLAALGLALLSPLVDLLPIEALPFLRGDWRSCGSRHYYRVVTQSDSTIHVVPLVMAAVGVAVCVTALLVRRWRLRR